MSKRKVLTVVYIVLLLFGLFLTLRPAASVLTYVSENYSDSEVFISVVLLFMSNILSGAFLSHFDFLIDSLFKRRKLKKRFAYRCPMLECVNRSCGHFDRECLACEFSRVTGVDFPDAPIVNPDPMTLEVSNIV